MHFCHNAITLFDLYLFADPEGLVIREKVNWIIKLIETICYIQGARNSTINILFKFLSSLHPQGAHAWLNYKLLWSVFFPAVRSCENCSMDCGNESVWSMDCGNESDWSMDCGNEYDWSMGCGNESDRSTPFCNNSWNKTLTTGMWGYKGGLYHLQLCNLP